jgi:hypothetical protein
MKTHLLKRIIDKNEMWLDLWQKHSFDLLPKITINIINRKLSELYIGWLFWEIRYNMSQEIGNTCFKRK